MIENRKEDESVFRPYPAPTKHGQYIYRNSGKAEKPIHGGTPCRDYERSIKGRLGSVKLEITMLGRQTFGKTYTVMRLSASQRGHPHGGDEPSITSPSFRI